MAIFYFLIFLGFCYLMWRLVIKPMIEETTGKKIDETRTMYTKKLEKIKKEHEEASASADAMNEAYELTKEAIAREKEIKRLEKKIESLKK